MVLTSPVPVTAPSLPAHLAAIVTADVLVRAAAAHGQALPWIAAVHAGGLAGQHAVEEDLIREGLDKAALGREAFAARAVALEADRRAGLATLLAGFGVGLDVEAAAASGQDAGRAARTAFVRLFEAGMLVEDERVVDVCPRCAAVVAGADALPDHLAVDDLCLRLPVLGALEATVRLEVRCLAPELLPGVVAVVVPPDHPAAGLSASVPMTAGAVPVVADPSVGEPTLLVPAHDAGALELSRRLGCAAVMVVGADGVVQAPGPLEGLARHAARVTAREMLDAEGAVVGVEEASEPTARCPACGTVLVPRLERHWFLAMGELETAAADAVRDGMVVVAPAGARDELLSRAGAGGEWCVSQPLWVGEPVPVGRCLDCGHVGVSVDAAASCGRCMGQVEAHDEVLDTRFIDCVWPLAATGWPAAARSPVEAHEPPLLVMAGHLLADVAPTVALALRLAGEVPFAAVALAPPAGGSRSAVTDEAPEVDLQALVDTGDPAVARVALLCDAADQAGAGEVVAGIRSPGQGSADLDGLENACAAALAAGTPAAALGMVVAAANEGVAPENVARLQALAAPFLGR